MTDRHAPVIWKPQPRQRAFMARSEPEALYGGAAGGGKSDALVVEALRQAHIPHYRGLILRKTFPQANIVAVDYDPGASEVNQLNRIKLMLSTAKKNLRAEEMSAIGQSPV